jgi:hypothetical protein
MIYSHNGIQLAEKKGNELSVMCYCFHELKKTLGWGRRARHRWPQAVWFYLWEILEQVKASMAKISGYLWDEVGEWSGKGTRELSRWHQCSLSPRKTRYPRVYVFVHSEHLHTWYMLISLFAKCIKYTRNLQANIEL